MPHILAKETLRKKLDDVSYSRAEAILDSFPGEYGFNPGSQIIQIVGLSVLDSFDHYIKERLRVKFYERFMDDFLLIDKSKERLKSYLKIIKEKIEGMGMKLNVKKTKIRKLTDGFLFLGFIFRLTTTGKVIMTLDPDKVKHERKKLYRMVQKVKRGEKTKERVDEHYRTWKAHARKGNTYNMLKRMDEYYKSLWEDDQYEVCETKW
jgi:hypothetical protein